MAIIESGDETLIVNKQKRSLSLQVEGRLTLERPDGTQRSIKVNARANSFIEDQNDYVYGRGDVTAEGARVIVEAVKAHVAKKPDRFMSTGDAKFVEGSEDLNVEKLEVYESSTVANISKPIDLSYNEDWPKDSSDSDKVRWILENEPMFNTDDIVGMVGCSRSLVSDVKSRID